MSVRHGGELPVGLEIHDGPADEISRFLEKRKVYRALDQADIAAPKQHWGLTAESTFAGAGRGTSQNRMCERSADGLDGSLLLLLCCADETSVHNHSGLDRIGAGIEIN